MVDYEQIRQQLDTVTGEQWREVNRRIIGRTKPDTRHNLTLLLGELKIGLPTREDGLIDDEAVKELLYSTKNHGPSARVLNFLSHRSSHVSEETMNLIDKYY